MEVQVLEGAFVEVPTGDATGAELHVARPSVGIGVGNPGGGTFTP